jgi:hypothetical protein
MVRTSALFGAGALFIGNEALMNDRGLVINGLIHLDPSGATVSYWCIAAVGAAFVAVGLLKFLWDSFLQHRITLTEAEISAPRFSFSWTPTAVKLADVRHLSMQVVQKQRSLAIYHASGKLTIAESLLPNRTTFEELCSAIANRVPGRLPQG